MSRKEHWNEAWERRLESEVSWYQEMPRLSLAMIGRAAVGADSSLIDVGSGATVLVGHLLDQGFHDITVLDIAEQAQDKARRLLGERAQQVTWICEDVLQYSSTRRFDIWHDRACFHFLTEAEDRAQYIRVLRRCLAPGGQAIISTFALGGPEECSGLPVAQYDAGRLLQELGRDFKLEEQAEEVHRTPGGAEQLFAWFRIRHIEEGQQ